MRVEEKKGVEIEIDDSSAQFKIDVAEFKGTEKPFSRMVFPSYACAIESCSKAFDRIIPSLDLINAKCENFEKKFFISLETALQKGQVSAMVGKVMFVRQLLDNLIRLRTKTEGFQRECLDKAICYLGAGLSLIGITPGVPHVLIKKVTQEKVGFVKKSRDPKGVDRMIQKILDFGRYFQMPLTLKDYNTAGACTYITHAIYSDRKLKNQYELLIDFYKKINSKINETITAKGLAKIMPPVVSKEIMQRTEEKYKDLRFALFPDFIPKTHSGAEPEEKLELSDAYKSKEQILTSSIATPVVEVESLEIKPNFCLEPFAQHYLNLAKRYQSLINALKDIVKGEVDSRNLVEGLKDIGDLMYGFYALSCENLGVEIVNPEEKHELREVIKERVLVSLKKEYTKKETQMPNLDRCKRKALKWIKEMGNDKHLQKEDKVKPLKISVSYSKEPILTISDRKLKKQTKFAPEEYLLFVAR